MIVTRFVKIVDRLLNDFERFVERLLNDG